MMHHLVNIMESTVLEALDEVLRNNEGLCDCDRCRFDIAAIALNRLPPSYVVTAEGAVLSRVKHMKAQNMVDVIRAITEGIDIVCQNPRHDSLKLTINS